MYILDLILEDWPVPVGRGDVDGAALVVEGVGRVVTLFVPPFGDPQLDVGPLVHHADGQRVQLFFAPLQQQNNKKKKNDMTNQLIQ